MIRVLNAGSIGLRGTTGPLPVTPATDLASEGARREFRIGRGADRRDDGDAVSATADHACRVVWMNAADGNQVTTRDAPQSSQADEAPFGGGVGLRGRGEDAADPEVIGLGWRGRRRHVRDLFRGVRHDRRGAKREQGVGGGVQHHEVGDAVDERSGCANALDVVPEQGGSIDGVSQTPMIAHVEKAVGTGRFLTLGTEAAANHCVRLTRHPEVDGTTRGQISLTP